METKQCVGCNENLSLDLFSFRNKAKGTLQSRCKKCYNLYNRHYYKNFERDKQITRVGKNTKKLRERYQTWKSQQSCCVCREDAVECLDLHHVDPKEKDGNISLLLAYNSWNRVVEEIQKCVVVCSNCHRKIHSGRISTSQYHRSLIGKATLF